MALSANKILRNVQKNEILTFKSHRKNTVDQW